ncbi:hypothetical protein D3C76_1612540 [compost metagenome]
MSQRHQPDQADAADPADRGMAEQRMYIHGVTIRRNADPEPADQLHLDSFYYISAPSGVAIAAVILLRAIALRITAECPMQHFSILQISVKINIYRRLA